MAFRRRVVATRAPHTIQCPRCSQLRNRLSVYATPEGRACYSCLTSAAREERTQEQVSVPDVPAGRPSTCPETDCGRLPGHKGEHRPSLHRRSNVPAGSVSYGA